MVPLSKDLKYKSGDYTPMSKPEIRYPYASYFEEFPGCCRDFVMHGFAHISGRRPLTDDEWFFGIVENFAGYFGESPYWVNIADSIGTILFAHSSKENTGLFTPEKFADWLEFRGETVVSLKHKHITTFMWAPSKQFWKDLEKYNKNKEKAEQEKNADNNERGVRAA